jgi:signal transduction histidine kinase
VTVSGRVVEWVGRLPPAVGDGAIGAGIFVIGALGQLTTPDAVLPHAQRPAAIGLLAVACLGVVLRRRSLWGASVLILIAALGGTFTWNDYWGNLLPEVVVLYTISERTRLSVSLLALLGAYVVRFLNTGPFFGPDVHYTFSDLPKLVQSDFWFLALAWFAGRAQARRRAITSALASRAEDLRRERDGLARSAVATERSRIAGELHTLVVRGVQRMIAATQKARRILASDPSRAARSVATIEAIGRDTLVQMRRLLLLLRASNGKIAPPSTSASPQEDGRLHRSLMADLPGSPSPVAVRWGHLGQWVERTRSWASTAWVTDVLVVLGLTALAVAENFSYPGFPFRRIDIALTVAVTGALLFRRLAPIAVLTVVASCMFAWSALFTIAAGAGDRALFVAVYTVAVLRGPWWSVFAIGAEVIAYVPTIFERPQINWPYDLAGSSALFLLIAVAGLAVRESRRLHADLLDQTKILRRTREQRVRLAVDEERTRIARDVHDTVAHGVALMVIQAGAARWLAETNSRKAEEALGAVERAGREATRELRSLVGDLGRSSHGHNDTRPAEGHLTIQGLVDEASRTLGRVELVVRGEPRELDTALEVSLSRIVQEALTNVRKHAPGARVWVEIAYAPEGVEVEVTDTGGAAPSGAETLPGAGQGLIGIAERVALFGGRVEAGPTAEGGFRVRASLAREAVPV